MMVMIVTVAMIMRVLVAVIMIAVAMSVIVVSLFVSARAVLGIMRMNALRMKRFETIIQ